MSRPAEDCQRMVHACSVCRSRFPTGGLLCDPCWASAGSLCMRCHKTAARTEKKFLHCCKE
eukprot:7466969-Karenia_brevis.AAC.1